MPFFGGKYMKTAPYTVPEGFFEKIESETLDKVHVIRRRRRLAAGLGAAAVAIVLSIMTVLPARSPENALAGADLEEQMLEVYEYDIFLTTLNL